MAGHRETGSRRACAGSLCRRLLPGRPGARGEEAPRVEARANASPRPAVSRSGTPAGARGRPAGVLDLGEPHRGPASRRTPGRRCWGISSRASATPRAGATTRGDSRRASRRPARAGATGVLGRWERCRSHGAGRAAAAGRRESRGNGERARLRAGSSWVPAASRRQRLDPPLDAVLRLCPEQQGRPPTVSIIVRNLSDQESTAVEQRPCGLTPAGRAEPCQPPAHVLAHPRRATPTTTSPTVQPATEDRLRHLVFLDGRLIDVWTAGRGHALPRDRRQARPGASRSAGGTTSRSPRRRRHELVLDLARRRRRRDACPPGPRHPAPARGRAHRRGTPSTSCWLGPGTSSSTQSSWWRAGPPRSAVRRVDADLVMPTSPPG